MQMLIWTRYLYAGFSWHRGWQLQAGQQYAQSATAPGPGQSMTCPWNAATQTAVLAFWTAQGALLPEAEVQPHQLAQQRQKRKAILRWAGQHHRHRNVLFLQAYMARMRAACDGDTTPLDAVQLALAHADFIPKNRDPAGLVAGIGALRQALAAHGIVVTMNSTTLAGMVSTAAATNMTTKLPPLLAALASLPVSVDPPVMVQRAPILLNIVDPGKVLPRRVAALQQLDSTLDVRKVL